MMLLISMYLVISPIIEKPQIEYLYATLFILGGMIFYVPFVYYGVQIKHLGLTQTSFFLLIIARDKVEKTTKKKLFQ